MDFRSLSRRELQILCKKNKIPANMTNVAMVDALSALLEVEGIEEILNARESEVPKSPKKVGDECLEHPRTAVRTSARIKSIKENPQNSQPSIRTRRGTATRCAEELNQESKDLNVAFTPALPSGRRKYVAASACKKVDFENENNEFPQTPTVPTNQKRVGATSSRRRTSTQHIETTEKRVYSTRRSVRILEKTMENLSLKEEENINQTSVPIVYDEMPKGTVGAGSEVTNLETGSTKADDSISEFDVDMEINNQAKNETNPEEQSSNESETESDLTSELDSEKRSIDDEITKNVDVYESNEVDAAVDSAQDIDNGPAPDIDNFSTILKSGAEVDNSLNSDSEIMIDETFDHNKEVFDAETEGNEGMEMISIQQADAIGNDHYKNIEKPTTDMVENNPDNFVDVKIKFLMNEEHSQPKLVENIEMEEPLVDEISVPSADDLVDVKIKFLMNETLEDVDYSQPKLKFEEPLVDEISVPSLPNETSLAPFASDELAGQFPRPTVECPVKEPTTKLLIDISEAEESNGELKEDMSLRQLRKMFKTKMGLKQNAVDKQIKVGKVRTALQPLPENGMSMME